MNADVISDTPTVGPHLSVETKFMQNYRVATPVHAGGEIAAIANGNGQVELFTIGSDGTVWNIYPDPSSQTGYNSVSMGFKAEIMAVATSSKGQILLFTAHGMQISYVQETGEPNARWSPSKQFTLTPNSGSAIPPKILRIIPQQLPDKSLGVGVVYTSSPNTGVIYYNFGLGSLNILAPTLYGGDTTYHSSPYWVWMGNANNLWTSTYFGSVTTNVFRCGLRNHQTRSDPVTNASKTRDIDSAIGPDGIFQVFAILDDGNLYQLTGNPDTNGPFTWRALSHDMNFRQVQAVTDAKGHFQIFAVASNNEIYHVQTDSRSSTGYSDPSPIHKNVGRISAARNNNGLIDIFATGTTHNSLTLLVQEENSTNWVPISIEVTKSGQVEEYISYSSDVTVLDKAGAPLIETPVKVWSSEESRITVNGATYFVAPQRPAYLSTNSAGMLSISQETGSLGIPALQLNVPTVMPREHSLVVEQSAGVQNDLAHVTGPGLMEAKDASGNYVLPDTSRNTKNTDDLARACNNCMAMLAPLGPSTASLLQRQGRRPGVWLRTSEDQPQPGRIGTPPVEQHWQLSFGADGISYETLTAAEAQARIAHKKATYETIIATEAKARINRKKAPPMNTRDLGSWLEDIGDFLAGVVEGIIDVVDTVVTAVGNGVNSVFTFIIDGVKRVFDVVITWVGQAFDVVEVFFAQLAAPFEKLFEWLGEVFGWADILRTHEALAYTINQMPDFLAKAAPKIKTWLDNGIDTLQGQIKPSIDKAIEKIGGEASVGGYAQSKQPSDPKYSTALSNNIIYNGMLDNAPGARLLSAPLQAVEATRFDQFLQKLTTYVDTAEADTAFAEARTYFQNLGSQPDQIFTQALSGLLRALEGVAQLALSGVQGVIDLLLEMVPELMVTLKEMLNEVWDIPFVSRFYTWLTATEARPEGSKLTMVDLLALLVAIPSTAIYKFTNQGRAPFPDEKSVTDFKSSFNAQTLLNASGFGSAAERRAALRTQPLVPSTLGVLMGLSSGISTYFYGGLTAIIDLYPPSPGDKPPNQLPRKGIGQPPPALLKWALGMEWAWQTFSCPWYLSPGDVGCQQPEAMGKGMWVYQWLSCAVDAGYVFIEKRMPESETVGAVLFMFYGIAHLSFAAQASEGSDSLVYAGNIIPTIPEILKILRFKWIVQGTEGTSLVVLAGSEFLLYTSSAIITMVLAAPPSPEQSLA
jgi:hypothetical protein